MRTNEIPTVAMQVYPYVRDIIERDRMLDLKQLKRAFGRAHYHDKRIPQIAGERNLGRILEQICEM
jgi:hypothetical protein